MGNMAAHSPGRRYCRWASQRLDPWPPRASRLADKFGSPSCAGGRRTLLGAAVAVSLATFDGSPKCAPGTDGCRGSSTSSAIFDNIHPAGNTEFGGDTTAVDVACT